MRIRQQLVASTKNISTHPNDRTSVTVHMTGNTGVGANAAAHANLQSKPNPRVASWHWTVDDDEAVQSFLHRVRTFHAGTAAGNRSSISVEICINRDGDYVQAVRNGAALVARILRDERLSINAVVQHFRWSGKNCPTDIRAGRAGISWAAFITLVAMELNGTGGTPVVPNPEVPQYAPITKVNQERLADLGYYFGQFDGKGGPMVHAAVVAFQRDAGLVQDGAAGPITTDRITKEHNMLRDDLLNAISDLRRDIPGLVREEVNRPLEGPDGVVRETAQTKAKVERHDLRVMTFVLADGRKGVQLLPARTWRIAPDDDTLKRFLDVMRFQGAELSDEAWSTVRSWEKVRGIQGVLIENPLALGNQEPWGYLPGAEEPEAPAEETPAEPEPEVTPKRTRNRAAATPAEVVVSDAPEGGEAYIPADGGDGLIVPAGDPTEK